MEHLNHSSSNSSSISLQNQVVQVGTGILGICFLLGVPANIAVVVFLLRHLKKNNFTLHLLMNLAASDILRLVSVPLWIYNWNFAWALGHGLCKVTYLLAFTSTYCSVLTVTLISVQRYVVVLHRSQWAKLGSKGEKLLLLCLWALALIFASPAAVKADLADGQNKVCRRVTDGETIGILLFETLLGFVIPLSIMAIFYFCLHKKVKETPFFRNPRLARLVIAILITFFILWIPYHALNVVRIVGLAQRSTNLLVSKKLNNVAYLGYGALKTLTMLHSCVNPLLYAWSFRGRFQKPGKHPNKTQVKSDYVTNPHV